VIEERNSADEAVMLVKRWSNYAEFLKDKTGKSY